MTSTPITDFENDLFDLTGRTALITGGGKGIGRAITIALAGRGATVIAIGRDGGALESTIEPLGTRHSWIAGDLTDEKTYVEISDEVRDLDILINNAGGNPFAKPWAQQSSSDLLQTYEVNLIAANRLARLFSPGMIERKHGRIINIASIYGSLGQDPQARPSAKGGVAYIAAKHALVGLTRQLAIELAPHVNVNAVSPGMIAWRTPVTDEQVQVMKRNQERTPLARMGKPEDVAGVVVFLASEASSFVTGHDLIVDGGWSIW